MKHLFWHKVVECGLARYCANLSNIANNCQVLRAIANYCKCLPSIASICLLCAIVNYYKHLLSILSVYQDYKYLLCTAKTCDFVCHVILGIASTFTSKALNFLTLLLAAILTGLKIENRQDSLESHQEDGLSHFLEIPLCCLWYVC